MLEIRKTTRSGHATVFQLSPTPAALTIEIRETPCRFIAAIICAADCESSVGGDTIDEKGLLPRRKRKPSAVTTASVPVTAISTNAASRGSPRTTTTPWGTLALAPSRMTAVTWCPRSTASRTSHCPVAPLAPNTTSFIGRSMLMMETPSFFARGHEYLPSKRFAFHSRVGCAWSLAVDDSTRPRLAAGDLPGLLAWHIILIVAQPGRKRDPDTPAGEPPAFGKIVEDHFSRVFV